jgi:eukaryotic-like serine/threonine-protein kinase
VTAPSKRQPIPFGKYLLLDRINIGGMAEVWRGKSFGAGGFERLLAIKRILPTIAEDEEFISMFIDEAKITAQLNHANVAQVYDFGQLAGSYFIAMEYIPGKDLRAIFDRCRKRGEPAPIPLTCHLVSKICDGLDYAHRRRDGQGGEMNIVHRDISPQNVIVSYDGEVKVIDFGIAKAAGRASQTQAGILKGKFAYMSPEQIRGRPVDRRSDVFAIGICLYEMLTGERLFVGDSDFSVLEKVRRAEVLPPSTYNKRIPEVLEKIVLKALAREVEDRYQYASDLGEDLQRFLVCSEAMFGGKDLMAFMQATFAEDVEREKLRLKDYAEIKSPEASSAEPEKGPVPSAAPPPPQGPLQPIPLTTALVGPAWVPPQDNQPPRIAPVLAPPPSAPAAPVQPRRSPSLTNLPRLTAAAPMLTNRSEDDGDATRGARGQLDFHDVPEPKTVPSSDYAPQAPAHGAPYDDDIDAPTVVRPDAHTHSLSNQTTDPELNSPRIFLAPAPVTLGPRDITPLPPSPPRPSRPEVRHVSVPPPAPLEVPATNPGASPFETYATEPPSAAGTKVLAAVVGALLLLLAGVGVVLLRGQPQGFLLLQLPEELKGQATVNVDGRPVEGWPPFLKVNAGPVAVSITAEGWHPFSAPVQVAQGQKPTVFEPPLERLSPSGPGEASRPEPLAFALHVTSQPEGADIFVGDKQVGVTPARLEVQEGTLELRLEKKCFDALVVPVKLPSAPGEASPVSGKLRKQPGCR